MDNWHVIYTKPRAEKKVEQRLNNFGIEAYCPVKVEIKQWADRKKKIFVPVLPAMVLVNIDKKKRNRVFDIPGVIRYMFWLGKHAIIQDDEVESLKSFITQNNIVTNTTETLKKGGTINVPGFKNQIGIIKKISKNQIWIVLKNLAYVIKLKIA